MKALVDLDSYKIAEINPINSLDYLQLEGLDRKAEIEINSPNLFKKQ